MSFQFNKDRSECHSLELRLSDYIENALSAREVWEVEKHLTSCADCTQAAQQMQATVQVLRSADRYDTGDDFMAKLHARLDDLEPETVRGRSLRNRVQDWLGGLQAGVRTWNVPALTAGFAAAALVLIVHGSLPTPPPQIAPASGTAAVAAGEDLSRQVAFTASNPFDDPVAAKAEVDGANGSGSESRAESGATTGNF